MAKRIIERVEDQDGLRSEIVPPEALAVDGKQARPKEGEPLDVSITIKAPGVFVARIWAGAILFAGQGKMNKIPIARGKPIQIRITQ